SGRSFRLPRPAALWGVEVGRRHGSPIGRDRSTKSRSGGGGSMDHDQRFKQLLKEFFPEFLALFFPDHAARLDFGSLQWLDKELFADPPEGQVLLLDLVARLRLRTHGGEETPAVALVHLEVESREAVRAFRRRMYDYYQTLRRKHDCPV